MSGQYSDHARLWAYITIYESTIFWYVSQKDVGFISDVEPHHYQTDKRIVFFFVEIVWFLRRASEHYFINIYSS